MSVPDKYKHEKDFHQVYYFLLKYYTGEKKAYVPTIFIGNLKNF
jgi:hypothetical protein